jgi:hypothetical protein
MSALQPIKTEIDLKSLAETGDLIPKLAGLEFHGRLVLAIDNRSGLSFNAVVEVYNPDDAS